MDLTKDSRRAAAAGRLADLNRDGRTDQQRLAPALEQARRLAAQLAPLFPAVAAVTRTGEGHAAWCAAWARQIANAGLTDAELAQGLARLAELMVASGNPPLSFSHFLQACRPAHLTGQDYEARQAKPPLLTRDRLQDPAWCAARDKALSKLRAQGHLH